MKKSSFYALLLAMCLLFTACGGPGTAPAESSEPEETKNMFADSMQKSDPSQDDVFNLLLVGNSATYYYVEELHGLAKAAGISMTVCNLYYSGATVDQHYYWWKADEAKCSFFVTDENGRVKTENATLLYSLRQRNWDAIGMTNGSASRSRYNPPEVTFGKLEPYLRALFDLYRKEFPMAKLYFQAGTPVEIGYAKNYTMSTYEQQQADNAIYRDLTKLIAKELDIDWVPRGDAAQIARTSPLVTNITARLGINGNLGDYYHDGDIGGGQYLTACVWFEVLTGQSCIGNTYRPVYTYAGQEYTLSEDMIAVLQQAAHEAVANKNN